MKGNMKKHRILKGEYGYRDFHRMRNTLITFLFAAAVAVQILIGRSAGGNLQTVLTVSGILTVLPLANIASPLIAMFRYRTAPQEILQKTEAYSDRGILLYDLVITSKDNIMPVDCCFISSRKIILYMPEGKTEPRVLKDWVSNQLTAAGIKFPASVYTKPDSFLKELKSIPQNEKSDYTAEEVKAAGVIKSLSY